MKRMLAFSLLTTVLVATPLVAGPPATKRPVCQAQKAPARDGKRLEPCRRPQSIPPVIDPTPMFLASTTGAPIQLADLS